MPPLEFGTAGPLDPCPVLVACALSRETRALQPLAKEYDIRLVTTGMGGQRTATFLEYELAQRTPPLMVFTGVAGALSPEPAMGQVIFPRKWFLEDGKCFEVSPQPVQLLGSKQWAIEGAGLTVRRPVIRPSTRARLYRETGALICDMEAAFALRIASSMKVQAVVLKAISDTAESGLADFWSHLDSNLGQLRTAVARLLRDLAVAPTVSTVE